MGTLVRELLGTELLPKKTEIFGGLGSKERGKNGGGEGIFSLILFFLFRAGQGRTTSRKSLFLPTFKVKKIFTIRVF